MQCGYRFFILETQSGSGPDLGKCFHLELNGEAKPPKGIVKRNAAFSSTLASAALAMTWSETKNK